MIAVLLNIVICATIVGVAIWVVIKKKPSSLGQSLASTLGVLGTFAGIFVGLVDFNVSDIQGSVPILLEGLKTAFLTSIFGMVFSLGLKVFYRYEEEPIEETGLSNVQDLLNAISYGVKDLNVNLSKILEVNANQKGVLEHIDTDIVNKSEKIVEHIDQFGEELAKQSTEKMMEAIKSVMEEFNAKINDKLADNIERWSEGVENLNEWQQRHVGLLTKLNAVSDDAKGKLDTLSNSIDRLEESYVVFDGLMKYLETVRDASKTTNDVVESMLIEMRKGWQAVSFQQQQMRTLVDNCEDWTKTLNGILQNGQKVLNDSQKELIAGMNGAMSMFSKNLIAVLDTYWTEINNKEDKRQNNRLF